MGDTKLKNYGLINELIYFSSDVVGANVPLKGGQKVTAVVKEDKTSHGLKATKRRLLESYAQQATEDHSGSYHMADTGFVPFEGDWLEVEYFIQPGTSNIMGSVKPMYCKHSEEVCITNLCGRHEMIDDTIFFTLDSLKLPDGYIPQRYDVVNVVMVESMQPCCIWRAVSITLVQRL
ncbi:PREDICTED: cancer/testis antigen 55 [Propithecus coquereli]|uniref:cancer/testis antigen 55 n=1 Tax=Propithecus coquereli TaxID=379532 RepID=UPI00063F4132|nr:PREDICTED: cancer/testis antigen 55 [Propithecus coquereli]